MIYGIDVSHHQSPAAMPWKALGQAGGFAIIRATYGSRLNDRACEEHVQRARDNGVKVGLYHFYRPSQPVVDQLDAFVSRFSRLGFGGGDIFPALDIELDPIPQAQPVTNAWSVRCYDLARDIATHCGGCLVYLTQRDWALMGKSEWPYEFPLWVPHWTPKPAPATPGDKPWTIWQHRVGPFHIGGVGGAIDLDNPSTIDQNRAEKLPLIEGPAYDDDRELERLLAYADSFLFDPIDNDRTPAVV